MIKLNLKNIKLKYTSKGASDFRLDVPSLEVKKGEFFTFVGQSGCGKTSMLRIIAGLLEVEDGIIKIDDKLVNELPSDKRGIGMVFQKSLLFPHMNVFENIAFGLKVKKEKKEEIKEKISKILTELNLEGFENKYPHQLSGGESQRVSLARTLILEPDILLMDEPFSALDASTRQDMHKLITNINKDKGITIVFVTHDIQEAFGLSDRIGVMHEGSLIVCGFPEEIYNNPRYLPLCGLVGIENVISLEAFKELLSYNSMSDISQRFKDLFPLVHEVDKSEVFLGIRSKDLRLKKDGVIRDAVFMRRAFKGDRYTLEFDKGSHRIIIDVNELKNDLIEGNVYDIDFDYDDIKIIKDWKQC